MSEDYLTLEKLAEEYKPFHNHICLMYGSELVRLLGVKEADDDFYYIGRSIGFNSNIVSYSAVGHCESLKGKLETYDHMENAFTLNGCPASETFQIVQYAGDREYENSIDGIRHTALGKLSRREIKALDLDEEEYTRGHKL